MIIGDLDLKNRYFLAPLAGISNLPFRLLNKEFGCALVYTEMISAQGLIRNGDKTKVLLRSNKNEKPVSYQIFGSDPYSLAEAAKICEAYGADIIDINMGCPVKKVIKNGAGCALLDDPKRVCAILKSVRSAINIPLTIKIRLGMGDARRSYLEVSKVAQSEGVDAICLHPRTKNQHFKGDVDLDALKLLKASVSIPVIGSGNLFNLSDVNKMFEYTRCDAVMIARGALGNPFIFSELIDKLGDDPYTLNEGSPVTVDRARIKDVIMKHVDLFLKHCGTTSCHREMKKHMIWYTKGLLGSASFRKRIVVTNDIQKMLQQVEEFFKV